jgi:hypothetical protein
MTTGVVSAIYLYPIKSCRRVALSRATVSATGLEGDRDWQLAAGMTPVTQRQHPELATVQPLPIDGGLRISAPGRPVIEVERPAVADTVTGSLVDVEVAVGDAGDEAAAWFSELLGDDVRLVARTPESHLAVPEPIDVFGQPIAFGDVAPVLVTGTASLAWLADRASEPFGMERFRPNLVVDGAEPFAEDTWARFRLGPARLRHGAAWPRCPIPQIDQETGERRREPASVLRAHRWCTAAPGLPPAIQGMVVSHGVFGVGCSIGPPGAVVAVGDELIVEEIRPPVELEPPQPG